MFLSFVFSIQINTFTIEMEEEKRFGLSPDVVVSVRSTVTTRLSFKTDEVWLEIMPRAFPSSVVCWRSQHFNGCVCAKGDIRSLK